MWPVSTPLHKRPNDLFVSYGHGDRAVVDPLVDWLRKSAGLKVWYDVNSAGAAQRTTDRLTRGIDSARGALFFVSKNWKASSWCRDEHEVALTQRRANEEYITIAAAIEESDIPLWFQISHVLELGRFDVQSAADLLRSLTPGSVLRLDNDQDVYYSGPWRDQSDTVKTAVRALHETGWRLVGDSPDHPEFSDSVARITSIIQSCRGLVAILPFRPSGGPHRTSPWVVEEVRIASNLGQPYLLLAEPGVIPPDDLVASSHGGRALELSGDRHDQQLGGTLQAFDDAISHARLSSAGTYSFLAASLLVDEAEMDALVSVVETVTNMTCVRGRDLTGQHAQDAIVDQIRGAAFVIADITDDNRNSLIESGVARGAGVPLHLMCRLPPDGNRKTRFMLQDMEIHWYTEPLERLGAAYRIARRYRRRVYAPGPG
jgi:hypothetical protein